MSDVREMLARLRQLVDAQHHGNVDFKRTFIDVRSMIEWLAKDRDKLRAENERLRTALEPFKCECAGRCERYEWMPAGNPTCARFTATAALERKPE
jgi:hypothetical protein